MLSKTAYETIILYSPKLLLFVCPGYRVYNVGGLNNAEAHELKYSVPFYGYMTPCDR